MDEPQLEDYKTVTGWFKALDKYKDKTRPGKKMATDEFRLSMKKPGAVDKYAKQQSKNEQEIKRKEMNWLQKQLEKEYKGMQREAKRVTGKSIDSESGPTVRDIMGKEYRQGVAKGGYVKKYAKGGGVRKVRT
jgi:hypothetical protein